MLSRLARIVKKERHVFHRGGAHLTFFRLFQRNGMRLVMLVNVHDFRMERGALRLGKHAVGDDDHHVADGAFARGGTVEGHHPEVALSRDGTTS